MVRRGLRELLRSEHLISAIGEPESPDAALDEVRRHGWDVVLLDLQMSGRTGLDLLTTIRTARPKTPILVVSAHPEDQQAVLMLRAGASGYVTKDAAPDALITAVKRVAAGGRYISDTLAEHRQRRAGRARAA